MNIFQSLAIILTVYLAVLSAAVIVHGIIDGIGMWWSTRTMHQSIHDFIDELDSFVESEEKKKKKKKREAK